jgi:hypothetical protein
MFFLVFLAPEYGITTRYIEKQSWRGWSQLMLINPFLILVSRKLSDWFCGTFGSNEMVGFSKTLNLLSEDGFPH